MSSVIGQGSGSHLAAHAVEEVTTPVGREISPAVLAAFGGNAAAVNRSLMEGGTALALMEWEALSDSPRAMVAIRPGVFYRRQEQEGGRLVEANEEGLDPNEFGDSDVESENEEVGFACAPEELAFMKRVARNRHREGGGQEQPVAAAAAREMSMSSSEGHEMVIVEESFEELQLEPVPHGSRGALAARYTPTMPEEMIVMEDFDIEAQFLTPVSKRSAATPSPIQAEEPEEYMCQFESLESN